MHNKIYFIPEFKKISLSNGLGVSWHKRNEINTMGVKIFVKGGSASETKEGVAHFLEHIIVTKLKSILIDDLGLSLTISGTTYYSYTIYSFTILPEDFEKVMGVLKNNIFDLEINKKYISSERSSIINEIMDYNSDPYEIIYNEIVKNRFNEENSAFREILGSIKSVESVSINDLRKEFSSFYFPKNVFIAISSPFNMDESVKKFFKDKFKNIKSEGNEVVFRDSTFSDFKVSHKNLESVKQNHFSLSFPVPEELDIENKIIFDFCYSFIIKLLEPIEDKGLVYSFDFGFEKSGKCSFMYINAPFKNLDDLREGSKLIVDTLKLNQKENYLKKEFNLVKNNKIQELLVGFESDGNVLDYLGYYQTKFGEIKKIKEILEETKNVSFETIIKTMKSILDFKNVNVLTFSNKSNSKAVTKIAKNIKY